MKFKGLDRLKRTIAAMPKETRDEIRKGLDEGASEMVAVAKALAPRDSGDLVDSIDKTFGDYRPDNANVRGVGAGGGGHDLAVTIHAGDRKAWYASLVEFGTAPHVNKGLFAGTQHPGTAAQPYFFPAYRLTRKRMKSKLSRAMRRAIKKAVS